MITHNWKNRAALALLAGIASILAVAPATAVSLPATREGCMNQWMFNGVWRVRVIKVEPSLDSNGKPNGWLVTEQWRNGTDKTVGPGSTFLNGQQLVLGNGATIGALDTTNGTLSQQALNFHTFAPATQYTHAQLFLATGNFDPNNKPAAVVIAFDRNKVARDRSLPQFTVSPANFRIKLNCTATGAAAQGGAFEIKAHEGCMNQWVANGIWRMRVKSIGPATDADGKQFGYRVTEEWVSQMKIKFGAGNTSMGDQQLVLQNGDTLAWGNVPAGTFASQRFLFHTVAPGESLQYDQIFGLLRGTFDPSNKPIKLLVPFSVKMRQYFGGPQFSSNSPNFRIKLDCTR